MTRWVGAVGLLAAVLVTAPTAGGCGDVTNTVETDAGVMADSIPQPLEDTLSGDPVSSCHPGGVTTFSPATYHPALSAGQGACVASASTDAFVQFYDACLGPNKTQVDCDSFAESSATCAGCLLTPSTATLYGPLISFGGFVLPNVAGCLELMGLHPSVEAGVDSQALACAKSLQALEECELTACKANCPVPSGGTLDLYDACAREADKAGCQSYASAAACADAYRTVDAGSSGDSGTLTSAACFLSFQDFYDAVAPFFCGPPAPSVPARDSGSAADAAAGEGAAPPPTMDAAGSDAALPKDAAVDAPPWPADAPAGD
ncbi:MAG TPA: hypothetical protein VKU41_01480 [Polyangiaceae bacterium]|nr:hypothetical protein [Polyangiaceae bacterium]